MSPFHKPAIVQQEAEQTEQDEANPPQYRQQKHGVVHVNVLSKDWTCATKRTLNRLEFSIDSQHILGKDNKDKLNVFMSLTRVHRRHGCQPVPQLRSDVRQSKLVALLLHITPSALYPATCMRARDSKFVSVKFVRNLPGATEETVHYPVQMFPSCIRVMRRQEVQITFPSGNHLMNSS